jgi:lipopolysaccharide export LptBFGC system permease protein LptF
MSRTLFWYVFKDLLVIFLMASGTLAGIMSFGGLLRPLTQNGLDASQILLLIRFSMPAMSTYSLPVAALFATTWVYGRMAADNEITACRASGISFLAMSTPAMFLGLFVAMMSMYLLCFTVPKNTLKIERVIVSNIAKIIVHQIEQAHETHFGFFTVYAESAHLVDADPNKPNQQAVVLRGPMIVSFASVPQRDKFFNVAKEFYMAREAVAYIDEDPAEGAEGSDQMTVMLSDGVKLPRRLTGPKSEQGGLGAAQFGPVDIPSRLGEKTKFMDIFQLKRLDRDPSRGRDVQNVTAQFIAEDQAAEFTRRLSVLLNSPQREWSFEAGGDAYSIVRPADAKIDVHAGTITMTAAAAGGKPLKFRQESGGQTRLTAEARSLEINTEADTAREQLIVSVELKDVLVDAGETQTPKSELPRNFVLPMPPDIAAMKTRTPDVYLGTAVRHESQRQRLLFAWVDLINHVRSEMHARAAFVVSCLLLVLVGASLGMMFRSGNFLTAFAVSVVPAMLSVVLIVTGQHTAENVPKDLTPFNNPLNAGIAIIWAGNVIIAIGAIVLLTRLQRK